MTETISPSSDDGGTEMAPSCRVISGSDVMVRHVLAAPAHDGDPVHDTGQGDGHHDDRKRGLAQQRADSQTLDHQTHHHRHGDGRDNGGPDGQMQRDQERVAQIARPA